jgi:hypothetical protein
MSAEAQSKDMANFGTRVAFAIQRDVWRNSGSQYSRKEHSGEK